MKYPAATKPIPATDKIIAWFLRTEPTADPSEYQPKEIACEKAITPANVTKK